MITFDTNVTVDDLESRAARLGTGDAESILLPTNLPGHTLSLQAAIIQFVITWARRHGNPVLFTHAQDANTPDPALTNLLATAHGLTAALLVRNVTDIRGSLIQAAERLAALRYKTLSKIEVRGGRLCLMVADSHPYSPRRAPFVGLAGDNRLTAKDAFINDFRFHLRRCFEASGASPLTDSDSNGILDAVYELFANTEEWGTSDLQFTPFSRGVRGILADVIPMTAVSRYVGSRSANLERHLTRYFKTILSDSDIAATHVLEVSIFDSGVGLARRDLRKPLDNSVSGEREYSSVLNCLRRHNTSSSDVTRGVGLFEVMRLMTRLRGFLQLRTGRLGLFRNFIDDEFIFDEHWSDSVRVSEFYRKFEYLWDWDSEPEIIRSSALAEVARKERPLVDGTLFTFWIPLKRLAVQLPLFPQ
jgi:hypothetical protein